MTRRTTRMQVIITPRNEQSVLGDRRDFALQLFSSFTGKLQNCVKMKFKQHRDDFREHPKRYVPFVYADNWKISYNRIPHIFPRIS